MKSPRRRAAKSPRVKLVMQSENDFASCAERLRALADPDRLRIVTALLEGPKNVSQLAGELAMPMVNLSHHLRVLRYAHVVQTRKEGKYVIYSLDPAISAQGERLRDRITLDLGCCRLDLVQSISSR